MKRALLTLAFLVVSTFAHSWLACSDYGEESGALYDNAKCRGFPRNYTGYYDATFALDRGFDWLPTANQACKHKRTGGTPWTTYYTSQYPMATYVAGERYCMAWPAKNHVASTCTNIYIPDGGIQILRSQVNPTDDPTQSEFLAGPFAAINGHVPNTIDFKGFQNCPNFCSSPPLSSDRSLCTGCFVVPQIPEGIYTFQWYWEFNAGQWYASCFEANIVSNVTSTTGLQVGTTTTAQATTAQPGTTAQQVTTAQGSVTTAQAFLTTGQPPVTTGTPVPTGVCSNDPTYCNTVCAGARVNMCSCTNGNWNIECAEKPNAASQLFVPSFLILAIIIKLLF